MVAAVVAVGLPACHDTDASDEPHAATLYDICEVGATDSSSTTLYLYPQNSDTPVELYADSSLGSDAPEVGKSIFVAYQPAGGIAYVSDRVAILTWANINNLDLQVAESSADLDGWDKDPVEVVSAWRGGSKIYMRLRLGYDATPRRFALVLDPATANDPIPTAYLYHARGESSPTFNRQYYIALNVASLWDSPSTTGLRLRVNASTSSDLTFIKK
jgi:hypothetical protein